MLSTCCGAIESSIERPCVEEKTSTERIGSGFVVLVKKSQGL